MAKPTRKPARKPQRPSSKSAVKKLKSRLNFGKKVPKPNISNSSNIS